MAKGRTWTRDELIVAMNLYCKLPFGQLHYRNPVIVALAAKLGRTPGSLAMKLCQLCLVRPCASCTRDQRLERGECSQTVPSGRNSIKIGRRLAFESEQRLAALDGKPIEAEAQIPAEDLPRQGLEREQVVRQRVNQQFFRAAVLAAYGGRCCITGLAVPDLADRQSHCSMGEGSGQPSQSSKRPLPERAP